MTLTEAHSCYESQTPVVFLDDKYMITGFRTYEDSVLIKKITIGNNYDSIPIKASYLKKV